MRQFTLNSDEAYAALCAPRDHPWIPNGALPRSPRLRDPEVVIERSADLKTPRPFRGRGLGEGA